MTLRRVHESFFSISIATSDKHVIAKVCFFNETFDRNTLDSSMWKVRLSSEKYLSKTLTSEFKVKIGEDHFDSTTSYALLRTLVVENDTTMSLFLGFGHHSDIDLLLQLEIDGLVRDNIEYLSCVVVRVNCR